VVLAVGLLLAVATFSGGLGYCSWVLGSGFWLRLARGV